MVREEELGDIHLLLDLSQAEVCQWFFLGPDWQYQLDHDVTLQQLQQHTRTVQWDLESDLFDQVKALNGSVVVPSATTA